MIDHTVIGVADVGRSAAFYDMALEALGLRRVMQMPENVGSDGIGHRDRDSACLWRGSFYQQDRAARGQPLHWISSGEAVRDSLPQLA